MPEHTSWLTFLLAYMRATLEHNSSSLGTSLMGIHPSWASFEPLATALLVVLLVLGLAMAARAKLLRLDESVVPDEKFTLRTFMEVFLGYFYDLAKSVMGPARAKKYFPLIGTSAVFVFVANVMALLPGMPIATTSLSVTLGCALVVFVAFNIYGIKTQGLWNYLKHFAGPSLPLAILVFPIELISVCVRPVTLAVRLMLNMAVDHLILGIFMGLVALLVPVPLMVLGTLIVLIQTLVFTLLTTIYISLATEHEHH